MKRPECIPTLAALLCAASAAACASMSVDAAAKAKLLAKENLRLKGELDAIRRVLAAPPPGVPER